MAWLGMRAITARSRGVSCSDVGVFIVGEHMGDRTENLGLNSCK
jgi:hypothetical protein